MHIAFRPRGGLEVREPLSERNSNVVLKAHMPLLVALVPSPNDQSPMNGFNPTDISSEFTCSCTPKSNASGLYRGFILSR